MVEARPGKVYHYANPFDPVTRQEFTVTRPVTVRRLLRQRKGLRHATGVRPIKHMGNRRVREFSRPTICLFNGRPLLRAQWSKVTVGAGDVCTFVTQLEGGNNTGKMIASIVIAIAIAVAAPYIAGPAVLGFAVGSLGFSLATAAIGIVLSAAAAGLMSLFAGPPPAANQAGFVSSPSLAGSAQSSPTFSIGAQGNRARLGSAQPELTGRHLIYPDYAMPSYTRYVDNEQYVHSLLVPSRGSIEIEKWRIGETPIESFEEITTEQREPGEVGDPEICDARWLTCSDLATVLLPDATADPPSPWKGPFATNPSGTIVDTFEVDHVTPGGLYKYNSSGSFDTKSVTVEIEVQEIDAAGVAVGDPDAWEAVDPITITAGDQREQRRTTTYELPFPGRWQVRERRTDTKDASVNARHDIQWTGLRGRLTTVRRFAGITTLAVRMKATGDLNSATSRQVNIIATRKLPTWDFETETMTEELAATRCPCDVFAHIARSWLSDDKIDLAGIYSHKEEFATAGWTFDFVWDQPIPMREALQRVARAVVGVEVEQGQKVCLVLDRASTAPSMLFTPRNIRKGSFKLDFKMVDDQTADGATGSYVDTNSWKPVTVIEAFDDSAQQNVSNIGTEGITNRQQLRAVLWNRLRENRYRRCAASFGTEMDGLTLLFGNTIDVAHDMADWGQHAEVTAWDEDTRTLTLSESMVFTPDALHYVAVRDSKGMKAGPFEATAGPNANSIVVGDGELPEILTGGRRERTVIQLGTVDNAPERLKVIMVDPEDEKHCNIVACIDDPRMYDPLPDDPTNPDGPFDPLDIHITSDTGTVNLRTLAAANGYTGNPVQAVTITVDGGVETGPIIRGTWPKDFKPTFVNRGTVSGVHGAAGMPGGHALNCSSGPLAIDNTDGILRGGGGGGGQGGAGGKGGDASMTTGGEFPFVVTADGGIGGAPGAGGAGGGGAGSPGSPGNPGVVLTGDGFTATAGNGGAGGGGGNGGAYGSPGAAGTPGTAGGNGISDAPISTVFEGAPGGAAQAGGAAGAAVKGNANVTWSGTGTRLGTILP